LLGLPGKTHISDTAAPESPSFFHCLPNTPL
jgi:hypothetical protein